MKTQLLISLIVLVSMTLRADEPIKPGEENFKTYTPDKFAKEIGVDPVDNMLVRIKFNYRSSLVIDAEKTGRQGTIESRDGVESVDVVIPTEGLAWFGKIPTSVSEDAINVKSFIVYARVKVDTAGTPFVRLVGNEINHDDFKGDTIIWRN
jgi:hypothetical protein